MRDTRGLTCTFYRIKGGIVSKKANAEPTQRNDLDDARKRPALDYKIQKRDAKNDGVDADYGRSIYICNGLLIATGEDLEASVRLVRKPSAIMPPPTRASVLGSGTGEGKFVVP